MKRASLLFILFCFVWGLSAQKYAHCVDSLIQNAVSESKIPGAVLCVVIDDKIDYLHAYGFRQVFPDTLPMTTKTQFDLASLSKVVGTGMSLMTLVDEGDIFVDDSIQLFLPEYENKQGAGRSLRVIDFLTHTSGLPAYAQYKTLLADNPSASIQERKNILLQFMAHCHRYAAPATEFRYSCLNFITLQYLIERVTGMPLDRYAQEAVFRPLGMTHTCYYPFGKSEKCRQIVAPTERIALFDSSAIVPPIIYQQIKNSTSWIDRKHPSLCYEAIVHDPLAREMNAGVSGNAGVFSTAEDLAKLAIWMLNPEKIKGPFSAATLQQMMSVPAGYEAFGRALAWDVSSDYSGCKGTQASASAVCHTGYTGTCMVVDPEKRMAVILLTNRVHPADGGAVGSLRRAVADEIFK